LFSFSKSSCSEYAIFFSSANFKRGLLFKTGLEAGTLKFDKMVEIKKKENK
jgi:hypothetical protein